MAGGRDLIFSLMAAARRVTLVAHCDDRKTLPSSLERVAVPCLDAGVRETG